MKRTAATLRFSFTLLLLVAWSATQVGCAPPNMAAPTFPKSPFWHEPEERADGWSLQCNKLTGHWRLLDESNIRRAWGTKEVCLKAYDTLYLELTSLEREYARRELEPNVPMPTLQGMQFWIDRRVRSGWRLQENVLTGHWRLLDGMGIRHGWGRREAVEVLWDETVVPLIGEPPDRVVIMLHGILRSKDCWFVLKDRLRREAEERGENMEIIAMNYPSTLVVNEVSARGVAGVVEQFPGDTPIVFICHSMGGLLAHTYFAGRDHPASQPPHPVEQSIYLGTPFRGAHMADLLQGFWLYEMIFGPAGLQLRTAPEIVNDLPWPDITTTAIAGSNPPDGFSPIIPGDDDGTVEIESALPDELTNKYTVETGHSFLMYAPSAIDIVVRRVFDEPPQLADDAVRAKEK